MHLSLSQIYIKLFVKVIRLTILMFFVRILQFQMLREVCYFIIMETITELQEALI
jgi:hypothetical protein